MPSKKIIWTGVVCLLIVGGIFVFLEYKNRPESTEVVNPGLAAYSQPALPNNTDWQQILKDVVHTATSSDINSIEYAKNVGVYGGKTPTEQFSRELFAKYMTLEQTDKASAGNYQNYEDIVNKYINTETVNQKITYYTPTDFQIINQETPAVIHKYGNDIGAMFVKAMNAKVENELTVLQRATENDDPSELKKLDASIAVYKEILHTLLTTSVPKSFSGSHLALINDTSVIITAIEAMKEIFNDPISVIGTIKQYPGAVSNFVPLLQIIKDLLIKSGANFQQGEAGYTFINTI